MTKIKLSAPWTTYYKEIHSMFRHDPEIEVQFDEENGIINIHVMDGVKANVLREFLPSEKTFGNVTVPINIMHIREIPFEQELTVAEKVTKLFEGNNAVDEIVNVKDFTGKEHVYVIFSAIVVQFFNDDLTDFNGYAHMLYQDIAKDIFNAPLGVNFCTSLIVDENNEETVAEAPVEAPVEEEAVEEEITEEVSE